MKKEKIKIITLSISALVILVSIIGYTYSYFSANVKEVNKTETLVKTNELNITYTGEQEINAGNMIPGDSFTKTFSVENTSNKEVTFNIYMENITNEFNKDLVYSLSDEEGTLLNNRILPTTNEGKTYLKANIQIEAHATRNYILTVKYEYLATTNQNINQGSTFSATVGIDTVQNAIASSRGILMPTIRDNTESFYSQKENITKVVLENTLSPKGNATYTYDVSEGQDKSVMSYLVANEENPNTYTLYLQGDGSIKANEDSSYLFYNFNNLTEIEGLEYLDTSNIISMRSMFGLCHNLLNLNVGSFDTSEVKDMAWMFEQCKSLVNIEGIENFDTSNVTLMGGMFRECNSITSLNLRHFNTTKVTNMYALFDQCRSLENLDISNFNTSNVVETAYMFNYCIKLQDLDLSHFNMDKVTNMEGMFGVCQNLANLNISSFSFNSEINMKWIFGGASNTAVITVKDAYTQTQILNLSSSYRPSSWTTDNVIVAL